MTRLYFDNVEFSINQNETGLITQYLKYQILLVKNVQNLS